MKTNKVIQVLYDERLVGTLALTSAHKAAFEYSEEWLETGFPVSPFSLPLKRQVFLPSKDYFGGLFGVFADSLPDAWAPSAPAFIKTAGGKCGLSHGSRPSRDCRFFRNGRAYLSAAV